MNFVPAVAYHFCLTFACSIHTTWPKPVSRALYRFEMDLSTNVFRNVNLLPVSVLVEVVALEPDDDEGHDRLHHAELQRCL